MPMIAPPNRGFADMQRTSPYDSGVLYSDSLLAIPIGGITTPTLDVGRFAYIGGTDTVTTQCSASFAWFVDSAATIESGACFFMLDGADIGDAAQYRIPNLGPFLQVSWLRVGGVGSHSSQLFGTNRYHPCQFIPQNSVLIDDQAANIGSLATVTRYPSDYYAGPCQVFTNCSNATSVIFEYLTTSNTWDRFYQVNPTAASLNNFNVTTPAGAWRVRFINGTNTSTTYYLTVTPSLTGSS